MSKGGSGAFRRQPTVWPTLPYILITLFQKICFFIVLSVMAFFSYHLRKDNFQIPWQFIALAVLVNYPTFQSVGQKANSPFT